MGGTCGKTVIVAITDSPFESGDREQVMLGKVGASVQKFSCLNESEVIEAARNAHVILCDASPVTRNVISGLSQLTGIRYHA